MKMLKDLAEVVREVEIKPGCWTDTEIMLRRFIRTHHATITDMAKRREAAVAQPRAVPEFVRYALERCLVSQEALAVSIDESNPDDPYASLMVNEDIDMIRRWLASCDKSESALNAAIDDMENAP